MGASLSISPRDGEITSVMRGVAVRMASSSAFRSSPATPIDMDNVSCDGLYLSGYYLCPDILNNVLSFVSTKDLLCNCQLVCKIWKQLIDCHTIWRLKCTRMYPSLQNIPPEFFRPICIKNPFGRNLIKNPDGKEGFKYWVMRSGGDGWIVEDPPAGADNLSTVEELAGITSCFATSYHKCTKFQIINLLKEGCTEQILDEYQPTIAISDWYAARFDCASRYQLTVSLLNASQHEVHKFEFGPIDEVQWAGNAWHKAEHEFKDYGPGIRYVKFHHLGHDLQFWAGRYGSKMTGSSVYLLIN